MTLPQPRPRKAARVERAADASATLRGILRKGMERKVFEAFLVPMTVPSGDGYAHILTRDASLLERSCPLPPVMTASGGDVLTSLTRRGQSDLRMAAVMRPCEARAVLELVKLGQVDLGNITLITMDCPGALPLRGFSADPEGGRARFAKAEGAWEESDLRRICQVCESMSMVCGDLHLGTRDGRAPTVPLISNTEKGDRVLEALGLEAGGDLGAWEEEAGALDRRHREQREAWRAAFRPSVQGPDALLLTLSSCINCHNCMRVCPVCYCRICYFDSERVRHRADDYLDQATRKGALRFPPDMLLFHLGRMAHMSLTCVSCGACEDACPASLPVAQLFSLVAERSQAAFEYVPGRDAKDPLPLTVYREEELEGDKDG